MYFFYLLLYQTSFMSESLHSPGKFMLFIHISFSVFQLLLPQTTDISKSNFCFLGTVDYYHLGEKYLFINSVEKTLQKFMSLTVSSELPSIP